MQLFKILATVVLTATAVFAAPTPSVANSTDTATATSSSSVAVATETAAAQAQAQAGAQAQAKPNVDLDVLNFALVLELLEAEFYKIGLTRFSADDFARAGMPRFVREEFLNINNHESVHVTFLTDVINTVFGAGKAVPKCEYNFDVALANVQNFVTFAGILERTGVSAYTGANRLLTNGDFLTAAATIATTEGRHSSFLNLITGQLPAVGSFDTPLGIQPIVSLAAPLIKTCPFQLPASPLPPLQVFGFRNRAAVNQAILLSFDIRGQVAPVKPGDVNVNVAFGASRNPAEVGLGNYQNLFCGFAFGLSQVRSPIVAVEAAAVNGQRVNVPGCLIPNQIAQEQFTQVVMFVVNSDSNVSLDTPQNVVAGPAVIDISL
ncbi:hypothetical protein HDU96_001864 [Phlyctochytrium bullatum]|nr:hypothetical protein HDU96_001864 [Phlyctochytrium bullatum]